jgi:hypothetical protein
MKTSPMNSYFPVKLNADGQVLDKDGKVTQVHRMVGSKLELNLPETCVWKQAWVEPADMKDDDSARQSALLARFSSSTTADGNNLVTLTPNKADLAKMTAAVERVDNRQILIDLNAPGLEATWEAIQAKKAVSLNLMPCYYQFGREQGGVQGTAGNETHIDYNLWAKEDLDRYGVVMTMPMNASLIAHEIGHLFGLNRKKLVNHYAQAQLAFTLVSGAAQVARPVAKQEVDNPLHHGGTHGGSGEHCTTGTKKDPPPAAPGDAFQYKPDPPKKTCVMHWTAANPHVNEQGFCAQCLESLRRSWDTSM